MLQVDGNAPRTAVSPAPYGIFFEEINHAGEGGLYAEMVLNRDFEITNLPNGARDGNRYYAFARDVVGQFTGAKGGLALFQSDDGLSWRASDHPKVLGARFAWADGTLSNANVERPALLFEDGLPIALFGATDGYRKDGGTSFNVHLPLRAVSKP